MPYEEDEYTLRQCPICKRIVRRENMKFSKDINEYPARLLCEKCYTEIMLKPPYYDKYESEVENQ